MKRVLGWVSLLGLGWPSLANAGNWGESWGSMVWGSVASVPTMGWLGGGVLLSLLVGLSWRRKPGRGGTVLGLLLALGLAQVAEAQVAVPNTFVNGTAADANEVNANFEALAAGVNANASAITGAQSTADAAASSASSAQGAAAAAQSTASGAVSDAANAQTTADGAAFAALNALDNAADAQSTADGAASAAASALSNAAAAQAAADAAEAQIAALQAQVAALIAGGLRFVECGDGLRVWDTATGLT